ncbi:MAG TPA: ABC transporter substrate-binding protein [Gammaproteobacteria bacterium]|jgi:NitT/TauT family transport system substrate-binding protein
MIDVAMGAGAGGFNWLPVLVAERHGLFAQRGLNVLRRRVGTVDKATAGVKSGELQLAITPPEGAIKDCVAGGRLRIIAANLNRLPLSLVANPRYRRIEDLKGARLGTSSLTEGTAIYTMEMLAKHGLEYPGDYEFAVVGVHPARWLALQEGRIDAAVQPIPFNFIATDAGFANLGEVSAYIPEIVFTAVITDASWAAANRAAVVALLAALIEATQIVYDSRNDATLVELAMELTDAGKDHAARALAYARDTALFPRDLGIPQSAFAKSLELMRKAKLADATTIAQAKAVLDDSFRRAAVESPQRARRR